MSIKVKCPYCGNEIYNDVEQCEYCKEFFKEPEIKGIKYTSLGAFIVFSCLTFGLYSIVWLLINYKPINNISNSRDRKKFRKLLSFGIPLCVLSSFFINYAFSLILIKILLLALSYRILRIIEKYSLIKYGSAIVHNEIGWFCFDILYVVYFLGTYSERVHSPGMRWCMNTKNWIIYSLIFIICATLVVLITYYISFFDVG